jgi:hypothetical protein
MEVVALEASHAVDDVVAAVEVIAEIASDRSAGARRHGQHEEARMSRGLLRVANDADALRQRAVELAPGLEDDVGLRACGGGREREPPSSTADDRDFPCPGRTDAL